MQRSYLGKNIYDIEQCSEIVYLSLVYNAVTSCHSWKFLQCVNYHWKRKVQQHFSSSSKKYAITYTSVCTLSFICQSVIPIDNLVAWNNHNPCLYNLILSNVTVSWNVNKAKTFKHNINTPKTSHIRNRLGNHVRYWNSNRNVWWTDSSSNPCRTKSIIILNN